MRPVLLWAKKTPRASALGVFALRHHLPLHFVLEPRVGVKASVDQLKVRVDQKIEQMQRHQLEQLQPSKLSCRPK